MKKKILCVSIVSFLCIMPSLQSMQQFYRVRQLLTPITTKSSSYWQQVKDAMQNFGSRSRAYFNSYNSYFPKPTYTTQVMPQPHPPVLTPSEKATIWASIATKFKHFFGYREPKNSVNDMFEELDVLLQDLTLKSKSELLYSFSFDRYKEKWKDMLTAEYNGITLLDTLLNFFVSRDALGNIQLQNLNYVGFVHPFFYALIANNVQLSSDGQKVAKQIYAKANALLAQGTSAADTIHLEDLKYMLKQYKMDTRQSEKE